MYLNIEQKKLVNLKPNGHILVKGVAGSGKTTIAIHRVPYLLANYCFSEDDKILLVTYNKTLVKYLRYLYNKLEDSSISFDTLTNDYKDKVFITSIDSIIFSYFSEYKIQNNCNLELINNNSIKYDVLNQAVTKLKNKYPNISYIDVQYLNFLIDEIEWIKSCNIRELTEYQNADRIGRASNINKDTPQKIQKNSETRKAIFELMQLYTYMLNEKGLLDFKDMALIVYEYLKNKENELNKFTHIIIDESQDLTKVQLDIIKLLYNQNKNYSSIMFVADTAQNIYSHSWLVKGRSFTSIGFDMTGKSYTLSKNYRTTVQIANLAYSLIEKTPEIIEDENFVKPSLIDKQGHIPVHKIFLNEEQEANFIYNEIVQKLSLEFQLKDIVIIAKNKKYLEYLNNYLNIKGLKTIFLNSNDNDFEYDAVRIVTMHSIKGLEFKVVFIAGLNANIIPYINYEDNEDAKIQETTDRKLLYVGMTRANELLYLTSSKKPSKFLFELNNNYLRIDSGCSLKRFYKLQMDDYKFVDKLKDIYSREEEVRQWLIKQLVDVYRYPTELIDIEYKVKLFSKTGFIDIIIFRYDKSKKKIPFIIFEVKPYLSGIEQGTEQLKSYMSVIDKCSFGVITDGNNILILDSAYNIVDDFPTFDISMLPSHIDEYEIIDFRNSNKFKFRKLNDSENMDIEQNGQYITIDASQQVKINLYEKVAAGYPIEVSDEVIDQIYIPGNIIKNPDKYFAIKVKGDSMIDANINNGDIAIVEKRNYAENRDVIIASLDGEITLKRFCKMGNTILLIPENSKYEPIPIKEEQIRIVGKVIGILRKSNN
ncbi:transcriptional repressor LexA [Caldicellulosiruptoraceae bacterium PP1]